jgi:transcription antitermination protein NusB
MAKRRGSRKIALETLYEHDVSGRPSADILGRHSDDASFAYAATLVEGVGEHQTEIDELITRYAEDWTLSRMPPIDRTLLRLGVLELLYLDVPAAVTINEAVDLAKQYSTADSGRFVNGILGRIAREAAAQV